MHCLDKKRCPLKHVLAIVEIRWLVFILYPQLVLKHLAQIDV